jgi:hypothetical protein
MPTFYVYIIIVIILIHVIIIVLSDANRSSGIISTNSELPTPRFFSAKLFRRMLPVNNDQRS